MYTNSLHWAFFHIMICPGVHALVTWIYVTSTHSHMALVYGRSSSLFNNSLLGNVIMYSVTMCSTSWNNLLIFLQVCYWQSCLELGLLGQSVNAPVVLLHLAWFPFMRVVPFCILLALGMSVSYQPFQQSTLLGFGIWDNPTVHQRLLRWLSGKEPACWHKRHGFSPWVGKIPWRRKWQSPPVFLPGESHGQNSLADYSPWGHSMSDVTELLSTHACIVHQWHLNILLNCVFKRTCGPRRGRG